MAPHTIIFIGPQGSGKGTQSELLEKVFKQHNQKVCLIQTGKQFRVFVEHGQGYAEKQVSQTLSSGVLQPVFLSVMLWGEHLRRHADPSHHLLFDGTPRTLDEAMILDSALNFYAHTTLTVIHLDTPEEIARERLLKRGRADDTEQSIGARLAWHREETVPVLEYYRKRPSTTVVDLDGTQPIEAIHSAVLGCVGLTQ